MALLNVIKTSTNINPDEFSFGPPQIVTLANGNFVVTYSSGADVFFEVFDPFGQFVTGGVPGDDFTSFGTAIATVSGGFALAWEGDGGFGPIHTAVYTEQGQVVAAALPVSTDDSGLDIFPMMTSLSGGGYAVVWQRDTSADSEIYTAIYDAQGVLVAAPINVTESPTVFGLLDPINGHRAANVVGLSTGGYALAWWGSGGANNEIYTAVYSELGVEITAAPVNVSQDAGDDSGVRIAALSTGGYALVWVHGSEIHTAVYDAAGNEVAPPTPVGGGADPRIAALAGGDYALFWSDGVDVYTAVYDNQGQEVSAPVNVSNGFGEDSSADITVLSNGAYALTWTSDFAGVGSDDLDLFTAVYTAQGEEAVGPINVTQSPGVNDFFPAATALADGAYAITWNSGDHPYTAVYQFLDLPLNEIQPSTDLTNDGVSFEPQIATLSNGNYALTYNNGTDVVWTVFDPQGQAIIGGGVPQGLVELAPAIAPVTGGFALAWEDAIAGGIWTAVFEEDGDPVLAPTLASGDLATDLRPIVTSLSNGGYAVTWHRLETSDIYTVAYDATGVVQGAGPINVTDSPATADQFGGTDVRPVAALAGGGYAIAWGSGSGSDLEIFTAIYGDIGQELVAPINVSNNPGEADNGPEIAALSTGGYALTWQRAAAGGASETVTAVYDALGNEVAAPTPVAIGPGNAARIAALDGGNYALFWTDGADVFTAVYDDEGEQVSTPVNVSDGLGIDTPWDIAVLSNGAYALSWTSGSDLFTAVYTAQGQQAVGPVNVTDSPGVGETFVQATALADGAYALSWEGGSGGFDVFTAVYQFVPPAPPADVTYDGVPGLINLDLSDITALGGSLTISNNGNLATIDLSALISIGGNFTLSNNGELLTITMPNLPSVGGAVSVTGDTGVVDLAFGNVTGVVSTTGSSATGIVTLDVDSAGGVNVSGNAGTVSTTSSNVTGNVTITDNTGPVSTGSGNVTGEITITENTGPVSTTSGDVTGNVTITDNNGAVSTGSGNVTGEITITENTGPVSTTSGDVTGDVTVTDNNGTVSTTSGNVTGNVTITDNTGPVSTTSSENVTGVVSITGNTTVTIDFGALISAGAIIISNNGVVTLDLSALVSAGGDVSIANNGNLLAIDMPNLATVDGSVSIQTSHTVIDLGSLDTVAGDVTIAAGPDAIAVDASALGPGGGTVTMDGGSEDDTTIVIGALANMGGTLTITGAGGVTIAAQAGLSALTITGTAGDDHVTGSATAANTMDGGGGDDTLTAGAGDDQVSGGAGGDTIVGGHGGGDDIYDGGADIDTVTYTSTTLDVVVDLAAGTATGAEIGSDTLIDIENFTGGSGDDRIGGNAADNALGGGAGSDTVIFTGQRRDYTIVTTIPGEYQITDNRAGANDGSDLVTGFESFQFSDITLAMANILNTAPVADADGPYGAGEDTLLSVDAVNGVLSGDSDLEGNALTAVLLSGPSNALSFTLNANGSFSYQGAAGFNGQDSFSYRAFDGQAYSGEIVVQLNVAPVNDAPTLANAIADQNATENSAFAFTVPSNTFADVDLGDNLTLTATLANGGPLPGWLTFDEETGAFSGTPLDADVITVRVTAADGALASAFDDFAITVANTNDAPTANPDLGSASENEIKGFAVLGNDTDPDVDDSKTLVSIGAVTVSSGNALVDEIDAEGAFSTAGQQIQFSPGVLFDPLGDGETATVAVNYTMQDAAGVTSSSVLTLTVTGAAEAPAFNVVNGTARNDRLTGTAGPDLINGLAGNDSIDTKGGDDLIVAGAGQDQVQTGGGDDTVVATIGDGNDWYDGGTGSDTFDFSGTSAPATVSLGTTLFGLTLNGVGRAASTQIGSDVLFSFENVIGGSGGDTITGDDRANTLAGGGGNDTMSGGDGNDHLVGGEGNDIMSGGGGSDTFVFAPGFGNDRINGFDANPAGGQDLLDISAFGIANAAEFAARVAIADVGADTLVTIDANSAQTIRLAGIGNAATVTQDDFLLV